MLLWAILIAIGGAAVGLAGLVASFAALRTLGRLRRTLALLHRESGGESFAEAAAAQVCAVDALRGDVEAMTDRIDSLAGEQRSALRRVGLVRYDAFPGVGGRMSWSAALLDDAGEGMVISAINGRSETRTYAKSLSGGTPSMPLSDEERRAIIDAGATPPRQLRKTA